MLPKSFYQKSAPELAKVLLGKKLVNGEASGIIVETEAYTQSDAASHSFKGETERTKIMFGSGGFVYVYFTYGMHYCFNVVSGDAGNGEAVLIRALEPVSGLELMKQRRNKEDERILTNGPAKLVQALGITKADYGRPLFEQDLYIAEAQTVTGNMIAAGPRIGITKAVDMPWRFWLKGNQFVSRP